MRIPTVTSLAVATLIAFGCSKTPEDKLIGEWKGTDSGGQTATQGASVGSMSSILQSVKDKYKVGAIIFSADKNGVPIFRTAIGNSTVGEPATTDMHFRIGAVGWQYLTELMLLMVEQGQLSLTDPVSKWYPNYPGANLATVRMLAASSTGFGEYITAPVFLNEVGADPFRVWSADDLITRSLPPYQTPQFTNPGQNWEYSHTPFVMLGAILEKVSGKPYATLLKEMILDPLKFSDTRLQFDANPQLPVLHTLTEDTFQDSTFWNPSWVSWAALTSNVCELAAWNRAFGAGTLLSSNSQKEVTSQVNVGLGPNTSQRYFGLGTMVFAPWIVQRASYWGMQTSTAYDPTTGISIVVTVSLTPQTPVNVAAVTEIISKVSQVLTPDHPVPM